MVSCWMVRAVVLFFFNDTATTEIYTLSLHDALPICGREVVVQGRGRLVTGLTRGDGADLRRAGEAQPALGLDARGDLVHRRGGDRKSTRLNSSHANISYAVFCLKKKKKL